MKKILLSLIKDKGSCGNVEFYPCHECVLYKNVCHCISDQEYFGRVLGEVETEEEHKYIEDKFIKTRYKKALRHYIEKCGKDEDLVEILI